MDRFDAMSILLTVVDAGSLSAAARQLGMPLATVSRKVTALEAHLGTRLLNRSSRQITLTDAGRAFAADCRRILEDLREAERAAAGEYSAPRGDLSLTTPIVFGRLHVLPVVLEFLTTYPDIDIRMVLSDHVVNLLEDPADLAVRIGVLPDSSLVARRVGVVRRVVCASPAYLVARGTPTDPRELATHTCVTFEGLASPGSWTFVRNGADFSVSVHSRLVVNTAEAAMDATIAGLGVTRLLSYQVAAAVRAGTLAIVLQDFEPEPWPVSLIHAGRPLQPMKMRALLDFATPRLKAALSL